MNELFEDTQDAIDRIIEGPVEELDELLNQIWAMYNLLEAENEAFKRGIREARSWLVPSMAAYQILGALFTTKEPE